MRATAYANRPSIVTDATGAQTGVFNTCRLDDLGQDPLPDTARAGSVAWVDPASR